MWRCEICTLDNELGATVCIACESPRPAGSRQQGQQGGGNAPAIWKCNMCTLENEVAAKACVACGTARSDQGGSTIASDGCGGGRTSHTATGSTEGDPSAHMWKCLLCTLENDLLSTTCIACGTARAGLDQRFQVPVSQHTSPSSTSASQRTTQPPSSSTMSTSSSPQRNERQAEQRQANTTEFRTGASGVVGARVWTCAMCHMENGVAGTKCLACGTPRPGFEPQAEAPKPEAPGPAPAPVAADIVEPLEVFGVKENGRPELSAGEIELKVERGLFLYKRDKRWIEDGSAIATSHRLLWTSGASDKASVPVRLALHLKHVADVQDRSAFMKTNKLCLLLRGQPESEGGMYFQLGFPKGSREDFGRALRKAVSAKEWERDADQSTPAGLLAQDVYKPKVHTGIGTLLEMQVKKNQATGAMMGEALGDLDGLMAHAKEMVGVAERMRASLQDKHAAEKQAEERDEHQSGENRVGEAGSRRQRDDELGGPDSPEEDDLSAMLLQTGIVNPVSKGVVGHDHYHAELAAQLIDFLKPLIPPKDARAVDDGVSVRSSVRGSTAMMMTLTDLFCVYNRARGIDLVSPADLRKACELFEKKGYPLRLHQFPSGVLVVQAAEGEGPTLLEILSFFPNGLAAADLANALGLSLALARDRLKAAELQGEICRDDSLEGLRFFPNRFK